MGKSGVPSPPDDAPLDDSPPVSTHDPPVCVLHRQRKAKYKAIVAKAGEDFKAGLASAGDKAGEDFKAGQTESARILGLAIVSAAVLITSSLSCFDGVQMGVWGVGAR